MKAMWNPLQSSLTSEHTENCVKLEVTKYLTDIEQLAKTMQDHIKNKGIWERIVSLLLEFNFKKYLRHRKLVIYYKIY